MTKTLLLLFISIFSASHLTYAQEGKILKLPLKIEEGYGPFSGSFGRVGASDTNSKENWHPTDLPAKGFPPKWKNFRYGALETDFLQWTYQNYKQGKLSDSDYIDLQKSWKWTPDENKLSAKPIKCYVHCAWNIDENGHMGDVILDANNNLDFSDDTIFTAQNFKGFDYRNPLKYAKYFEAEKYVDGKIVKLKCPVALTIDPPYIDYSIPIFAKTSFTENKHKYQIAVSCGFGGTDFSYSKIQLVKDYSTKIEDGELITEGEYITIGDKTYKHLGVDANKMTLNLEEVNTKNEIYSKQIGYKAFPFSGKEVNSGEEITLQKYKGKYVFIDFWGTWCAGCAMETPNLLNAYKKLDSNKIAFLGIAVDDKEQLKKYIEKEKILWPQILSNEENKIKDIYNIDSYPTTLLIDPNGKIIAKNLRGEDLAKKL